ncbi:hypothetical protein ACISSW_28805, partial [Escherichia coli]
TAGISLATLMFVFHTKRAKWRLMGLRGVGVCIKGTGEGRGRAGRGEEPGDFRLPRKMDNNFRLVNVYITDMKITEIPQK